MKNISDRDYEYASLEYHGEKDPRLLPRHLLENRCFTVGRYI